MIKIRKRRIASILAVVAAVSTILAWHRVDDSISEEDRRVIPKYLSGIAALPSAPARQYADEVAFVGNVQRAVLRIAPRHEGLPYDSEREPLDLLQAGHGLCYDRSRVIEKILRYAGFEVRHITFYSTVATGSALKALVRRRTPSHAVTEVLTTEGWLVVESNAPWMSLDVRRHPVSMNIIAASAKRVAHVQWEQPVPSVIYEQPFTFVYGLYSRHGRFYPPYDSIPDVNYGELVQNVW